MGGPSKDIPVRADRFQPRTVAEIFQQVEILRGTKSVPPSEIELFMGAVAEEVVIAGLNTQPNQQQSNDYQLLPDHLTILLPQRPDLADHMPVTPELVKKAKEKVRRLLPLQTEAASQTKRRLEQVGALLMNHILAREERNS